MQLCALNKEQSTVEKPNADNGADKVGGWQGDLLMFTHFPRRVSPNEIGCTTFLFRLGRVFFRVALNQQVAASFDSFEFFFSEKPKSV